MSRDQSGDGLNRSQCAYGDCENEPNGIYRGDGIEFPACDQCSPPYPAVENLTVQGERDEVKRRGE